jgi:hypothetical protein
VQAVESAALPVDDILPELPIRQWMVSFLHMLFVDGVYVEAGRRLGFRRVGAPERAELEALAQSLRERVGRHLERQGLFERDAENGYLALEPQGEEALANDRFGENGMTQSGRRETGSPRCPRSWGSGSALSEKFTPAWRPPAPTGAGLPRFVGGSPLHTGRRAVAVRPLRWLEGAAAPWGRGRARSRAQAISSAKRCCHPTA